MIQPNFPVLQNSGYQTGSQFQTDPSEETAYRAWLLRRDSARQQIRRLSRREMQVVALVSQGMANKSIAQELEISVKTIEKHRANAARKLGVNSTAELVRISVLADNEAQLFLPRSRTELPPNTTLSIRPSGN